MNIHPRNHISFRIETNKKTGSTAIPITLANKFLASRILLFLCFLVRWIQQCS